MAKPQCITDYEGALNQSADFVATIRHYINSSLVGAEAQAMTSVDATTPDRKRIKYSEIAKDDAKRLNFARSIAAGMGNYAKTEFPGFAKWDSENTFIAMNGLYGNGGAEVVATMVDRMVKAQGANFSFTTFYDTLSKPVVTDDGHVVKPGLDYVTGSIMSDARRVLKVDPTQNIDHVNDIIKWVNDEMQFDPAHAVQRTKVPDLETALKLLGNLGKSKDSFAPYRA